MCRCLLALCLPLFVAARARAQGDGPRVMPMSPVGLNVVSTTYMDMSSNYNFAQDIFVGNADVNSHVWALSYVRFLNVGGRFAQITLTPIFGDVGGTLVAQTAPGVSQTIQSPTISGFADPYVAFRIGLVGTPALKLPEFVKHKPGFQLSALLGAFIPIGDYKSTRPVNLGTNRWAIRAGLPMVKPWGTPAHQTLLEVTPSVYFYTTNNDPTGGADRRTQAPLFVVESHLTQNLTRKFWLGGDLRYQAGGETTTDSVADGNGANHFGGGPEMGYQVLRPLSVIAGWGRIFETSDGARGNMWRVRVNFVF